MFLPSPLRGRGVGGEGAKTTLPTQDDIGSRGEQSAAILERPRIGVKIVTNLRAKDDRAVRLEGQSGGQSRVNSLEAGALALGVVEEFEACRATQARAEIAGQVVEDPTPVGETDVGNVRREAVQSFRDI